MEVRQLHRLLFAHTPPGGGPSTLQMLLGSPVPPHDANAELREVYAAACAALVGQLGVVAVAPVDWEGYVRVFSGAFVDLAWVLTSTSAVSLCVILYRAGADARRSQLAHLAALFDLLCLLCYSIPAFNASLLRAPDGRLFLALNHTVRTHLTPGTGNDALAHATLSVIEAVSWSVPEDMVMQCVILSRQLLFVTECDRQALGSHTRARRPGDPAGPKAGCAGADACCQDALVIGSP